MTVWCRGISGARSTGFFQRKAQKWKKKGISIHGTPSNVAGLEAWQVLTSEGIKKAEGLAADIYMDKAVQAYTAGDEILCIIGEDTEECRLENVWIEFGENDSLRVFFDGYERQIKLEGRLSRTLEPNMGDLTFVDGKLTGIDYKTSRVKDALTGLEDGAFVLENYGKIRWLRIWRYTDIPVAPGNSEGNAGGGWDSV